MRIKKFILPGFLLFAFGNANALDVGIAAKAGLNGIGADLSLGLTDNINLRLSAAKIDIEGEDETITVGDTGFEGDVEAELDFDYGASALFLDWHVFGGGFRLTAGLFRNDGAAEVSGALQSAIVLDGQALDPSDIAGDISGEIELAESYQPYLGIGWGRGAGDGAGLSILVDLGVALLDPSVNLDANVNAGGVNGLSQAELDSRLREMESDAEGDLDDLEFWPVFAVGLNFRF